MMQFDDDRPRLSQGTPDAGPLPRSLGKALGVALGAALLVATFMLSMIVFAVLAVIGVLAWTYLWWKTRDLRRQMREHPAGGHVIDGEARREPPFRDPGDPGPNAGRPVD